MASKRLVFPDPLFPTKQLIFGEKLAENSW
jgi:hypothetical protein